MSSSVDSEYVQIVHDVLQYICNVRSSGKSKIPILDLIYQYCLINNLDPVKVGDAIHDDVYLTDIIMDECKSTGVLGRTVKIDDW